MSSGAAANHKKHGFAAELSKTNGGDHPARAIDSTQVKTADRGLRLQPIVRRFVSAKPVTKG